MLNVRRSVFETNSSSCHSIAFAHRQVKYEEPFYYMDEDEKYVEVRFGLYEWGPEILYCFESKLSYLLTMAARMQGIDIYFDPDTVGDMSQDAFYALREMKEFLESEPYREIEECVKKHIRCEGIRILPSAGNIDHESLHYHDYLSSYLLEWDVDSIDEFLFGDVIVLVDNDN